MQTLREKCKLFITLCRGVSHPIKTRGQCCARIFDRLDSFLFSDYRHLAGVTGRGVLRAACLPAKSGGAGRRHRLRHLPVERCDGGSPAGRTFKGPLQPLSPIVSRLFPRIKKDSAAAQAVCVNLAANLLGLGAAAAPAGIRAVREFQKSAPDQQTACDESILVILLNTASLQLIPTTAAMLRLQAGSAEPMAILPAVWVSTALSLTAGIIAAKAMAHLSPLSARPHPGTCARRGCRR